MVTQAKFRVGDPETFLRLQIVGELAGFRLSTSDVLQVCDTYMDTRSKRLFGAGYSFRRREQPDGLRMTLATLSQPSGAVHCWERWEILLASDSRLAKWPDSPIRTRMLQLIGNERLVTLVKFQQTRIIRSLCRGEQQVAEVRLDYMGYKTGANHQVHFEIEVELIPPAGEGTLLEIIDDLEEAWDLWPDQLTKFERAYTAAADIPAGRLKRTILKPAYR
jgi:inorganic triphosphatase YgiF